VAGTQLRANAQAFRAVSSESPICSEVVCKHIFGGCGKKIEQKEQLRKENLSFY
jgi:hypothetical protein